MKQKILIVEDEPEIVKLIEKRLDKTLYDVTVAYDGLSALELIERNYYDLLCLDIMLPSVDGLTLCAKARASNKNSLIIIISALDFEEEKAKAYALGADDYIAKPFSPKLVAIKVNSLLKRRTEILENEPLVLQKVVHESRLKRFYIENHPLVLTLSEYTIFKTLFMTPKRVFSKEELSQILYNEEIGSIDQKGIGTHK